MTLEELGNLGEFLGAIGVIVTLIYLTVQLRQNTRAIRAQTVDDVTRSLRDFLLVLAQSPELARIEAKAQQEGLSALEPNEESQLRGYLSAMFYTYENAYDQWQLATISEAQWSRYRALLVQVLQRFRYAREFWDGWKSFYLQTFVDEIEGML